MWLFIVCVAVIYVALVALISPVVAQSLSQNLEEE